MKLLMILENNEDIKDIDKELVAKCDIVVRDSYVEFPNTCKLIKYKNEIDENDKRIHYARAVKMLWN